MPATTLAALSAPAGVGPLLNPIADLAWKPAYSVNSWFATAHFEINGQVIDCLFHIMFVPSPGGMITAQGTLSITNETSGWQRAETLNVPMEQVRFGTAGVDIELPIGRLHGTLEDLHLNARLSDGAAAIDLHLIAASPVIFNGGTGQFPLLGMIINQYSVPRLATRGTLTLQGQTHEVQGIGWFDRQWQNDKPGLVLKWSWMGLNLGSDAVSLWSVPAIPGGEERAWASILHANGSQTVTAVEPGLGAADFWRSPATGACYPTRWTVRIPAMDAELHVLPNPCEQEIVVKQIPGQGWYEGASAVSGYWRGQPARGFGYVELLGAWR